MQGVNAPSTIRWTHKMENNLYLHESFVAELVHKFIIITRVTGDELAVTTDGHGQVIHAHNDIGADVMEDLLPEELKAIRTLTCKDE